MHAPHRSVEHNAAPESPFAHDDAFPVLPAWPAEAHFQVEPAAAGPHGIGPVVTRSAVVVGVLLLLLQFVSLVVESLPRQKRVAAGAPERLKEVVPVERKWFPDPTLRPGIKLVPVFPKQIFKEISPVDFS